MKRIKVLLSLSLLLSFTILSCSTEKITQRDTKKINYLDIEKGSTWNYDGVLLKEKKNIEIKITQKSDTFAIDNKNQKYIKDQYGYRNDDFYWIKYPLKNNFTWVNKYKGKIEIATIENVNTTFEFSGEKLKNCMKISYISTLESGKSILIRTFCPNIWLVSQELYYENSEGIALKQLSIKLKSFIK